MPESPPLPSQPAGTVSDRGLPGPGLPGALQPSCLRQDLTLCLCLADIISGKGSLRSWPHRLATGLLALNTTLIALLPRFLSSPPPHRCAPATLAPLLPETSQAHSHLRTFVPPVAFAWNAFLSHHSGLSSHVISSERFPPAPS